MENRFKVVVSRALVLCAAFCPVVAGAQTKTVQDTVFNASKVILASSQYTPSLQYNAQTYVVNSGVGYSASGYGKIWGVPDDDAAGNKWFESGYGLYAGDIIQRTHLLPTKPAGGDWYGYYYFLTGNAELDALDPADWAGNDAKGMDAEADFQSPDTEGGGYGPYSNSDDQFKTTYWNSDLYPLLVRRHFTLTADQKNTLGNSAVTLSCSYDECPKVYLNGTLIWQSDGWNDNDYATYSLSDGQKALLVEGDNVLAVSVRQGGGGGHIDFGLHVEREIATGMATVSNDNKGQACGGSVYTLTGICKGTSVEKLPAGIYIANGRKIMKK